MANSPKILIIDRDEKYAESLSQELNDLGFCARWVIDGLSALEITETLIPHLILLSLDSTEISGEDIFSTLKNNPDLERCLFVLQIKRYSEDVRSIYDSIGFNYCFRRSVEVLTLIKLLEVEGLFPQSHLHRSNSLSIRCP
jgi:CheY-like chemotaxis protein